MPLQLVSTANLYQWWFFFIYFFLTVLLPSNCVWGCVWFRAPVSQICTFCFYLHFSRHGNRARRFSLTTVIGNQLKSPHLDLCWISWRLQLLGLYSTLSGRFQPTAKYYWDHGLQFLSFICFFLFVSRVNKGVVPDIPELDFFFFDFFDCDLLQHNSKCLCRSILALSIVTHYNTCTHTHTHRKTLSSIQYMRCYSTDVCKQQCNTKCNQIQRWLYLYNAFF